MRNVRLSAKMGIGFGVMIAIAAILSTVSWLFLGRINRTVALAEDAAKGTLHFNDLRVEEKDFRAYGLETRHGETKNAIERWEEHKTELEDLLAALEMAADMRNEDKVAVQNARQSLKEYSTAFHSTTQAQQAKDDAFAKWGKIGWDITRSIAGARDEVIAPALQKAIENKDTDAFEQWLQLQESLNEDVVENFLVLRVTAVYLVATNKDKQWEDYQKQLQAAQQGAARWAQQVRGIAELENAAETIRASLEQYNEAGQQYYQAVLTERQADSTMTVEAANSMKIFEDLAETLENRKQSLVAFANTFSVILTGCGIVLGVLLAVYITRSIVKPINQIIAGLTEGAQQVAAASGQVSAASQSLAEGATEQAAGLEETSSSLEEMSSMTKQNADNAQQASTLASEARGAAKDGAELMQRMSRAIDDIQKSSDETAKIIKVIDEIAFQTNLLALNAAVEAARAGEAGKGFAVVAEEVRNLAMRSAEAAKNTANMIEESVKNAKNGVEISGEVSKALDEIVNGIAKTTDLVSEIAAASQEQAQGIDQVNTAVAQMDKVTQQNAANAEESASASEELNAQAEQMQSIVEELVGLVEGASGRRLQGHAQPPRRATGAGSSKPKLGLADHTFHAIADGKKDMSKSSQTKTKSTASAKKALPLDDDFSDFDA